MTDGGVVNISAVAGIKAAISDSSKRWPVFNDHVSLELGVNITRRKVLKGRLHVVYFQCRRGFIVDIFCE